MHADADFAANTHIVSHAGRLLATVEAGPLPYAEEWNFGVQHEFWRGVILEANYVGSEGVHLPLNLPYNNIPFYAALGNHDDPNQRFYKNFGMGGKRFYTYQKGDIRFFALDSNYMDKDQQRWLEDEREQLRRAACDAGKLLVQRELLAGNPIAAARVAQRLTELAPSDESANRPY